MKISGLQKTSLIDYPDNISTVLFTQGCNMNCPYCHNPGLIPKEGFNKYLNIDKFLQFLEQREELIDGIVITGGEPLIQESVINLMERIKEYGLLIKLDTNGTNFHLLKNIIDNKLVDYIAMDYKGPIEDYGKFCGNVINKRILDNIKRSKELIISSDFDYELRTTIVPEMHTEDIISKIAKELKGTSTYYIQNFRSEKVNSVKLNNKRSFSEEELNNFRNIFIREGIQTKIRN
ncbi:MAG: anaerobic ribonucleoside-triphosphate reductase activating protein [Halanaerobiales bacterium]|nr:anaerobic ribonucleoside-triphosphate reductase activating protein [Halanaerobiales bacterium]